MDGTNMDEEDIKNRIHHAFDLSQISNIFSSFLITMKNQEQKILQLEKNLEISNARYHELASTVNLIEYNIQGFEVLDEDTNEIKLQKSRPSSHVSGKTPRVIRRNTFTQDDRLKSFNSEGDQIKYQIKMNVSDEVAITDTPVETNMDHSIQPPIPEISSDVSPNSKINSKSNSINPSRRPSQSNSLKSSPRLSGTNLTKDHPSLHSSRNVSPRTSSAVIFPLPDSEKDQDGLISNIPSHDPLDEYAHAAPSEIDNNLPASPSGTSVSSLTFVSHQQHPEAIHHSAVNSARQATPREVATDDPNPSLQLIQNDILHLQQSLQHPNIVEEEDEFDKAIREIADFDPSLSLKKSIPVADSESKRSVPILGTNPLSTVKYHPKAESQESLSTYPSLELPSPSSTSREHIPAEQTATQSSHSVSQGDSPVNTRKRIGLFEQVDRKPEDLDLGKKSVGKSKLDPKMTVNNRLQALEDTIYAMSDVINSHHRALNAIPEKLKKFDVADFQTQLKKLSHTIEHFKSEALLESHLHLNSGAFQSSKLPSHEFHEPSSTRSRAAFFPDNHPQSRPENNVFDHHFSHPENHITMESFSNDVILELCRRVTETIPQVIPTPQFPSVSKLPDYEIQALAERLLSCVQLDINSQPNQTEANGMAEASKPPDERFITRGELNQLFENAMHSPLQITIPSDHDDLLRPIMSPEPREPSFASDRPHSQPSLSSTAQEARPESIDHDLKSLSDKFQRAISLHIQQNALNYVTHDDLEASLKSSYAHFETELQKQVEQSQGLSDEGNRNPSTSHLEKDVANLHQLVHKLDDALKTHISTVYLKEKQLSIDQADNQSWRPELERVNENIMKSMNDHKELAKALLVDLQQLQRDIQNRVDEQRLSTLLQEIDGKIQQQVIEGVDPVNNSIASIVRAVKHKADRREMERLVLERIAQTEETIRKLEEQQLEQENNRLRDCAGGVKCLSCGAIRKGVQVMHVTADPNIDLSPTKNAGSDYDQLLSVLNRQAGLKPLSRQTKPLIPMTPIARPASTAVVSPILKKGQGSVGLNQEPLYRRAKAASLMKEIPKIPMVSFGPGHPADMYHFDQEASSSPNNRVRLPKVTSS